MPLCPVRPVRPPEEVHSMLHGYEELDLHEETRFYIPDEGFNLVPRADLAMPTYWGDYEELRDLVTRRQPYRPGFIERVEDFLRDIPHEIRMRLARYLRRRSY